MRLKIDILDMVMVIQQGVESDNQSCNWKKRYFSARRS